MDEWIALVPDAGTLMYALITAAHNEEAYIEQVLDSVVAQTILPSKWIIVSDASTDGTDEMVRRYAARFAFIRLLSLNDTHERAFSSKVYALNSATKCLSVEGYEFIGHLDADISFDSTYMASLFGRFERDRRLGIAGGFIYEKRNGRFRLRRGNRVTSVPGAIQMFRRECHQTQGGFVPLPFGGEDWHAEVKARMNGWTVESFPDLIVHHHRPTGAAGGLFRNCYREGRMDYSLGCHPVFEVLRLLRRWRTRPFVLGALIRFCGFASGYAGKKSRMVSPDFVTFLRKEQLRRLWPFRGARAKGCAVLTGHPQRTK